MSEANQTQATGHRPLATSLDYALKLLAGRRYFIKEFAIALDKKFPNTDNTPLLEKLIEAGYFDDERLLKDFVLAHIRRGHGGRYISDRLRRKGVTASASEIERIAREEDFSLARDKLKSLALKYIGRHQGAEPYKIRRKLFNYLAGRGFSAQEIINVLEEVYRDEGDFS